METARRQDRCPTVAAPALSCRHPLCPAIEPAGNRSRPIAATGSPLRGSWRRRPALAPCRGRRCRPPEDGIGPTPSDGCWVPSTPDPRASHLIASPVAPPPSSPSFLAAANPAPGLAGSAVGQDRMPEDDRPSFPALGLTQRCLVNAFVHVLIDVVP